MDDNDYFTIARHVHHSISSKDRPPVVGALPAPDDQEAILDAARLGAGGGWGPERLSAHLRRAHGRDLSPDAVRIVLARKRT